MLKIRGLCAGYSDLKVLFDVDLDVEEREVVALVGSNGAGKTTLLRAISGLIPITGGTLEWFGADLTKIPAHMRAGMGISQILQGRGILGTLTIQDNLFLGSYAKRTRKKRFQLIERVYATFPILEKRQHLLAGTLSGGQQQMLAIGRAMMMEPRLLILDEPSLGLAPIVVDEVFRIIRTFREAGASMLLIEQNLVKALQVADRGYVLETGKIQLHGPSRDLLVNPAVRKAYLGI
ncbi:MAG: ABC transporter ATP-binding protein [Planctomycetota bacterium]|jgi:branched-chain amino acid transport system ATP-binding protein|nr:ABC transporter ATP-binding protein [Planctomycetota bacterium]